MMQAEDYCETSVNIRQTAFAYPDYVSSTFFCKVDKHLPDYTESRLESHVQFLFM